MQPRIYDSWPWMFFIAKEVSYRSYRDNFTLGELRTKWRKTTLYYLNPTMVIYGFAHYEQFNHWKLRYTEPCNIFTKRAVKGTGLAKHICVTEEMRTVFHGLLRLKILKKPRYYEILQMPLRLDSLQLCQCRFLSMMTPSNGNLFRVTGHLCAEFTGLRWIPRTKASDAELWCFLWSVSE